MLCKRCDKSEAVIVKRRKTKDVCEPCYQILIREGKLRSLKKYNQKRRQTEKYKEYARKKSKEWKELRPTKTKPSKRAAICPSCQGKEPRPTKSNQKTRFSDLCVDCYIVAIAESRKTSNDKYEKKRSKDPTYLKLQSIRATRWKRNNPEKVKLQESSNKEKRLEYGRRSYQKNKNNPLYKIRRRIKSGIRRAIKNTGYTKNRKSFEMLGKRPKDYLERFSSFLGNPCVCGIICDNKTIISDTNSHCDHIIPLSTAKTEEDVIRLNQPENLQIICIECNLSKSDNIIREDSND